MCSLRIIIVLLAVTSAPCVDALACGTNDCLSSTPALSVYPPAAAPSPAGPAPQHKCRIAWEWLSSCSFIFSAIGMMGHAIPWIVFWCTADWRAAKYDSFTEATTIVETICAFFSLLVHLAFVSVVNTDSIVSELVGIFFGIQQLHYIMEKKAQAIDEYTIGHYHNFGRSFLFWSFWLSFGVLLAVFCRLQHTGPPNQERAFMWMLLISAAAHFFKAFAVILPLIHRYRENAWEDDSGIAYAGKLLIAVTQIMSSGYDVWNFWCYNLYWSGGIPGNRSALSLAIMSTCCGLLLLLARVIGPGKFKRLLNFIGRLKAQDTLPFAISLYAGNPPNPLELSVSRVHVKQLQLELKKAQWEVRYKDRHLQLMESHLNQRDARLNAQERLIERQHIELNQLRRLNDQGFVARQHELTQQLSKDIEQRELQRQHMDKQLKEKDDEIKANKGQMLGKLQKFNQVIGELGLDIKQLNEEKTKQTEQLKVKDAELQAKDHLMSQKVNDLTEQIQGLLKCNEELHLKLAKQRQEANKGQLLGQLINKLNEENTKQTEQLMVKDAELQAKDHLMSQKVNDLTEQI